jgi:hypothetical protein
MYCYILSDVSSNVYVIAIFLIVYFQTSPIGTFMIYVITKFHKLRYSTMSVKLGLMLREERRLRVFKDGVLRRIIGPTKDGVTGEWRRLCNEEFNDLYYSPNFIRVDR